jgi:DNA-binding MarR family transcriptional regulator
MNEDVVRDLGYTMLGSRLKRLGERMQADVGRMFRREGLALVPAHYATLKALQRHGELTVGRLAQSLGVAQPGTTRTLALLEAGGLVRTVQRGSDQRTKTIALTEKGEATVAQVSREIEPMVVRALSDICAGLEGTILVQLDAIEDALERSPLDERGRQNSEREKTA